MSGGDHYRMELNNLLQVTLGTGTLRWDSAQHGPQHSTPWTAIAYINGVEYGRGQAQTLGDAKEAAAKIAYRAVYHTIYSRYPPE